MSNGKHIAWFACVFLCVYKGVLGRHNFDNSVDTRCITPTRRPGNCLILERCPTLYNAFLMRGIDDNARKYLDNALCRYENGKPVVCCERNAGECVTVDKKPGSCVPLRRSEALLTYLESKPFMSEEVVKYMRRSECHYGKDHTPRVCGPIFSNSITGESIEEVTPKPTPKSTSKPTPTPVTIPTSAPIVDQWPWAKPISSRSSTLPTPGDEEGFCGIPESADRIIGGNVTDIYEYPWMALIQMGDGILACGGSLINNRYVLTAAHCVVGPKVQQHQNVSRVRLGEWDTELPEDCIKRSGGNDDCADDPVNIDAEEIIPHPNFSTQTFQHDIALIRLKEPAPYSEFIRPICLPTTPVEIPSNITVAGWGRTEIALSSNVKLSLRIPNYDKEKCVTKYGGGRSGQKINLGRGHFCAGGVKDQDSCTGDSGGPAMTTVNIPGKSHVFFQVGLVSFGPQICGLPDVPGVYTKVEEYMGWILDNMRP